MLPVPVCLPFRSLPVPFVPACLFSFPVCSVRLVCLSGSFSVRLVQFRLILVQISFSSFLVQLSLFCARAFSRAGLFILFPRILYTKRAQRQMNFLSKNMSFLIISVSSLNYPGLEHFSPLHFASNRPLDTPPSRCSLPHRQEKGRINIASQNNPPPLLQVAPPRKTGEKTKNSAVRAPRLPIPSRAQRAFRGAQRPKKRKPTNPSPIPRRKPD